MAFSMEKMLVPTFPIELMMVDTAVDCRVVREGEAMVRKTFPVRNREMAFWIFILKAEYE
jgi:hypothetical protein